MMAEVPTEHLQLQKIRAAAEAVLAKLDNLDDPQTVEIIKSILLTTLGFTKNLGGLVNGLFEYDFDGWEDHSGATIVEMDNYPTGVGKKCVRLATNGYVTQAFYPAIYSNRLKSVTFAIKGLNVPFESRFFYQDGSQSFVSETGGSTWSVKEASPEIDKYIVAIRFKKVSGLSYGYLDFINFNSDPTTLPKLSDLTWWGIGAVENPPADTPIFGHVPESGKTLKVYGLKLVTPDPTMNMASIYVGGTFADIWLWSNSQSQILIFESPYYVMEGDGSTAFEIRNMLAGAGWYVATILAEEV